MHLSMSEVPELSGRDPRTITKQLKQYAAAKRAPCRTNQPRRGPLVYAVDNLEAARAEDTS